MPRPVAIGVPCDVCHKDEYWDNRENKKNAKAPDWSCANKECPGKDGYKFGRWERDRAKWDKKAPPVRPSPSPDAPQGGRITGDDTTPDEQGKRVFTYEALTYTYSVLLRKTVEAFEKAKVPLDPNAVQAAVATLLIQGEKAHIPLLHPRKVEVVEKPKPKPVPKEREEEFADFEEVPESELPF